MCMFPSELQHSHRVFFLLSSPLLVGLRGSGAQRFPPAVCLREAEGTAGPDGGSGLRGPDGISGHRARQAAPGVPAGPLNPISSPHTIAECSPLPVFFESVLKSLNNLSNVLDS